MFVVKKHFGSSQVRVGDFKNQADAEKLIQEKLREDIRFKVNATYGLYDWDELLREFKQSDVVADATKSSDSAADNSSGQGAGSRSSFSPTPFNTAPRPGGMPHSWIKDEDDKKK
jgi:hypothetical protein